MCLMATEINIPRGAQAATEGARLCWSCQAALANNAHFCPECGKVQPPAELDYFAFFGLPRRLQIDTKALEKEFYRLSRKLHPDLYVRAAGEEQQWSLEKSSRLNDAYRTLRDAIARTQYLLELEGVKLEEQSSAATEAARESGEQKKQAVPPELLEEVFELNMQLQELKMNREMGEEDASVAEGLQSAKQNFEQRLAGMDEELRSIWREWDAIVDDSQSTEAQRVPVRQKMVELLNRRNYIRNLVREVNQALTQ